jgi:hypothetical protein
MKVPYALIAATPLDQRHAQMYHAIHLGLPRLQPVPIDDSRGSLSIACYGPSLADTWQDLRHPILSMSGATHFLADRGVIPDYHIDMDPRAHKVKHLDPPVPGVHYVMASVCPPQTWEILKDERVTLWHVYSGRASADGPSTYDWVAEHDKGEIVVHAGSTIGLSAIHIGGLLGFRHFDIHGMDGSFADGTREHRHAGVHYGHKQAKDGITWDAEGVTYHTSKIMSNAVAETINTARNFPIFCVFHGRGLTQALIREAGLPNSCTADQTEKAKRIRSSTARFINVPAVKHASSFWEILLSQSAAVEQLPGILTICREAEPRRIHAKYNTGTVPVETALMLRLLSLQYQVKTAVEIGTFIGTSTLAIGAEEVFTCDRDNNCLPSLPGVTTHPYTTSTAMLEGLAARGVRADLFFFDGRIQPADVPLIQTLAHPRTVYAFDDFNGTAKGVVNAQMLGPLLPDHALAPPYTASDGQSTLAALVPID